MGPDNREKHVIFLVFCVVEEVYLVVTWGVYFLYIFYLCYYLLLFCYD